MRIIKISPGPNFSLYLRYEDGSEGEVDLSSLAGKGVFVAWLEPGVFERVTLSEAGAPEWPGGLDLCPDALYMRLTGKRPEDVFPPLRRMTSHA